MLAAAVPANAQAPLPPLPPVGGQPPPGERPPPEQPPRQPPGPVTQAPGSVTEHVDVAQTGHLPDDLLVPPLVPRWAVDGHPATLLAAEGRVYSVEGNGSVRAIDQGTGRTLWGATVPTGPAGAAYDAGRLFVSGDDLHAFDARTGALLWKQHLNRVAFAGPPVASGGVVYVAHGQGGDVLHAFRQSDGALLWRKPAPSGIGAVALDGERAYASGCDGTVAFDRTTGDTVWTHNACSAGADTAPAVHRGRVYAPGGTVVDARTGAAAGSFPGVRPVFVDEFGLFRSEDWFRTAELASGRERWRLRGMTYPVMAVGHDVYVVHDGYAKAFDAQTGLLLWSHKVGSWSPGNTPPPVLAAAPGLLLVANRGRIEAFEPAIVPGPREVGVGVYSDEVAAGGRALLAGVVGSELRGGRPVTAIETARWRKGGFRRVARVTPLRDGGFAAPVRVVRNTRIRARAAGAASKPVTVYAYPTVRFGPQARVGRGRVRMEVAVRNPSVRLGGRTLGLYLDRHATEGLELLDTGPLRGGTAARAVLSYRERGPYDKRDLVWWCIRGQLSLELGRPGPLTKRCGARSLPEPEA